MKEMQEKEEEDLMFGWLHRLFNKNAAAKKDEPLPKGTVLGTVPKPEFKSLREVMEILLAPSKYSHVLNGDSDKKSGKKPPSNKK